MPTRPRILVVDDEPANIMALSGLLAAHYTVLVAAGGAKALDIAATAPPPDLILLDVMMPEPDGFEVCRRLKADARTAGIPVIFVTAQGEAEFETLGFELGAVDYISKPFHPAVVMARVRTQIDRHRKLMLLETLAFIDGLTELPNRRYFDDALARAWSRAGRDGAPLSLLMVDIDHFKSVNDTYGHAAGDECLTIVGRRMAAEVLRGDDVVARLGGEEFAVLLQHTAAADAAAVAQRLCDAIAAQDISLPFAKRTIRVTVSIGCGSIWPGETARDAKAFQEAVDALLYRAKTSGRNRVVAEETSTP